MAQINFYELLCDEDELNADIDLFKNRQVKANEIFVIMEISKELAYEFVRDYHYLGDAMFLSKYQFGLWCEGMLVGVATYSNPQGKTALKGWFGLDNDDQSVLELSRLCMLPRLNGTNATSYLLGNSLRMLKQYGIRAVISLADASRHNGAIYQVCNFRYYGLTAPKCDYYINGVKHTRGSTKNRGGYGCREQESTVTHSISTNNLNAYMQNNLIPKNMTIQRRTYEHC